MLVLLGGASSCNETCFTGEGTSRTEVRALEAFHTFRLSGQFKVVLGMVAPTEPERIELTDGSRLLSRYRTVVQDSVLTLTDDNTCGWTRDLDDAARPVCTLFVRPHLRKILAFDITDLNAPDTLRLPELTIDLETNGTARLCLRSENLVVTVRNGADCILKGYAGVAVLNNYNLGLVDAHALQTGYCFIWQYGPRRARVWAVKELGGVLGRRTTVGVRIPYPPVLSYRNEGGTLEPEP